VVGDVNATLACTVISKRLNIKVCHIESGLRSGDMTMPEEINRLVTDRLTDQMLTPDRLSSENLINKGTAPAKIKFVGNIMIDTLEANRESAARLQLIDIIEKNLIGGRINKVPELLDNEYSVITLHRPSNVDSESIFKPLTEFLLSEVTKDQILIWPIHPRARKQLNVIRLWDKVLSNPSLILLEPVDYHEMLRLNMGARMVFTDSGGLQEECCVLGTPCLTLRWNTERPVTLRKNGGASVLVGNNLDRIREEYYNTNRIKRIPSRPELWDGHAAERIVKGILEYN
jgi:UDP-N-acetylglucosamine 2-epimerase (non-hydrolysing)